MFRFRIGLALPSTNLPLRRALERASAAGASGVQLDAVGDLAPERLSQTGRRDLRRVLAACGLELAALSCPFRRGFDDPQQLDVRVERVKQTLTMAYDLGPRLVTVFAGVLPGGADDVKNAAAIARLRDSLDAAAQHADRVGAVLAIDNGTELPATLAAFLGGFSRGGLGVNFDPATALVSGFDPAGALAELASWVRHVQARDARRGRGGRPGEETVLGGGDVDWTRLPAALEGIDYRGWLTIRRFAAADPLAEAPAAIAFLRRLGVGEAIQPRG